MIDRLRGFEIVSNEFRKTTLSEVVLPKRSTEFSAGYDVYNNEENVMLGQEELRLFWTDVKAYMQFDEVLTAHIRSSLAVKKGLELVNSVGIIDCDYYNNVKNEGNICIVLRNTNNFPVTIKTGERIIQVIFTKYLIADNDNVRVKRIGGTGSTG